MSFQFENKVEISRKKVDVKKMKFHEEFRDENLDFIHKIPTLNSKWKLK